MIPNGEGSEANFEWGWHYLTEKKLSALLRGIKHQKIIVIFIVWIVFIPLKQTKKKNPELHKNICENKDVL